MTSSRNNDASYNSGRTVNEGWMKRSVFAIYDTDDSRECFLRDAAIASPSQIFLSVMRPWDYVAEKGERTRFARMANYRLLTRNVNANNQSAWQFYTVLYSSFDCVRIKIYAGTYVYFTIIIYRMFILPIIIY